MATKERSQNVIVGDTILLRFISWNSNNFANVKEIQKVDIYFLDPAEKSCTEPCGKRLVETIDGSDITLEDVGKYLLTLATSTPTYVIGKYSDEWSVVFEDNDEVSVIDNYFNIYPDLWFTSTMPAVYGFDFRFQPNRIRKGSKKYLIIQIVPNVPRATDLERYYVNLAINSGLSVTIEQACGPCTPAEEDLRLIVEEEEVTVRDGVFGYYLLDTTELDCGIYNLTLRLDYLDSVEISPKMQFQIF